MSIFFGPFTTELEGSLEAVLPRYNVVATPTAYAALRAELYAPPYLRAEGTVTLGVPVMIAFEAMMPTPFLDALGVYSFNGELGAVLPAINSDLRPAGERLRAVLPRLRTMLTTATPASAGFPLPLMMFLHGEFEAPMVVEDLVLEDDTVADWAIVLQAIIRMSDTPLVLMKLQSTLTASVLAQDLFTVVLQSMLADQVDVEDTPASTLRMLYLLADQLSVNDDAVGTYNALVVIASAVVLSSVWTPGVDGGIESEFEFTEELIGRISFLVELLSELEAEDALLPQVLAFALLEEGVGVSDDTAALVAMLAELLDEVSLGFRIVTGDGDAFIGYSVNTRNAAVAEYQNYPFNSFAIVGGIPFGAGPDGIYRLEGNDDDGAPINSSIYTGLSDFGDSHLKKMPAAWVGLTSDGDMVLKVVTADTGKKKENWYRMKARPQGTPVDSRFSPAKGLTGRYWGFEITNIDGADFTLDSLKVWPLVMQRRYSGR